MTVLLGVSVGTRAVRTARPRPEQFTPRAADPPDRIADVDRPLFFRNEFIDSVGHDLSHLAAESIEAATVSEPELATGITYRDPRQADALHHALAGANLQNYRLVHEVDAVVEYLATTGEAGKCRTVALFDLGSSGLTVSVVDLIDRTVIASERTGDYSGDRFDGYVRDNQLQRLGKQASDPDMPQFEMRCRTAKERLSTQDAVCLPDAGGMILLSRDNFELSIVDVLDEAVEFARAVMIGANVPIDAVVLIGGGARMPIVQTRVGPLLELPSIVPIEPETVAARGAALAARPQSRARTRSSSAGSRPIVAASDAADRMGSKESVVLSASEPAAGAAAAPGTSADPVPFRLKNIYWLDADYDDDDGEDDRTRARRRLRTGGVVGLGLAAVVGVSGFMLTHEDSPQVVDTSVSRTQSQAPTATTTPEVAPSPPVLPPPLPEPETTIEQTTVPEAEDYEEPGTTVPTTTADSAPTEEPAPPAEPPPPPPPPPLIPGLPDFTLPVFPPLP